MHVLPDLQSTWTLRALECLGSGISSESVPNSPWKLRVSHLPVHGNPGKSLHLPAGEATGKTLHGLGCFRHVSPSAEGSRSLNDSCPGIGRGAGVTFLHCESTQPSSWDWGSFYHRPSFHWPHPLCPGGWLQGQWGNGPWVHAILLDHHDDHISLATWPLPPQYLFTLFLFCPYSSSLPRAVQECCYSPVYAKLHSLMSCWGGVLRAPSRTLREQGHWAIQAQYLPISVFGCLLSICEKEIAGPKMESLLLSPSKTYHLT